MKEKKNSLVVKNNDLNGYTFYKSPVQLKVFSKLIIEIRQNPEKQIYRIPINDLLHEIHFKENGNSELKKIVKKMGQMIEIPKEKGFKFSALFYNIETEDSTYLDFEVNPTLKPYLINLSYSFTAYYLENISRLQSYYSIRIYELLKQYQNKELSGWWKVSIEDLRNILKIEQKKYARYNDFKRFVLLQAQKELEEKTDIKFTFEEHKIGRKIERLTFFIMENKKKNSVKKADTKIIDLVLNEESQKVNKENYKAHRLYRDLHDKLGLDDNFIQEIFTKYDDVRIEKNMQYTLKEINKGVNIPSVGGYFRTALKTNYANQKSLSEVKSNLAKEKKEKEAQELRNKQYQAEFLESLKKDFEQEKKNLIYQYIDNNLTSSFEYYKIFKETKKSSFYELENLNQDELKDFAMNEKTIESSIFRVAFYEEMIENKIDFMEYARKRGMI